jgi:hypothetical protein
MPLASTRNRHNNTPPLKSSIRQLGVFCSQLVKKQKLSSPQGRGVISINVISDDSTDSSFSARLSFGV